MATCSLGTLQAQACANGFTCLDPDTSRAVELQLWKNLAGDDSTLGELISQACSNQFLCVSQSPQLFKSVYLQLLCNNSGGS